MVRRVERQHSLAEKFPDIAAQVDRSQHPTLNLFDLRAASTDKLWFRCDQGEDHSWLVRVNFRVKGQSCQVCVGAQIVPGVNDLPTVSPEIASRWHPTKNLPVLVSEVGAKNSKAFWWVCPEGHDHSTAPRDLVSGRRGCGVCSGKLLLTGVNDLATVVPQVVTEWNFERNAPLDPSQINGGSRERYWWVCPKGHNYQASAYGRRRGQGCNVCSGTVVEAGSTDIATTHPHLAALWDYERNAPALPTQVSQGSPKKFYWLGENCNHSYLKQVNEMVKGKGCPYCAGMAVLVGFNDLASCAPEVATEWHPTKNGELTPEEVTFGSSQKVWWLCPEGHSYHCEVHRRKTGRGCGVCAGKSVEPGMTDLASQYPEVAKLWHPTFNAPDTPTEAPTGSSKKRFWLGVCGHTFKASVKRMVRGAHCSYCSPTNKQVLSGHNDLAHRFPAVAAEWHPTKNGNVTPDKVAGQSGKVYWWQCSVNPKHEWEAGVGNRTGLGSGCPSCAKQSSASERDMADFIQSLDVGEVITNKRGLIKSMPRYELDVYVPGKNIAVEFNGIFWHRERPDLNAPPGRNNLGRNRTVHYDKWKACKDAGIQLIQVWEDEWKRNPEQVKRMLAHKLGVQYGDERKVMARKTTVVEVSKRQADVFLDRNHVQGAASGSRYLALVEKNAQVDVAAALAGDISTAIVAVLVLRNYAGSQGKTLEIVRYATSAVVSGGFTKLMKHAERAYEPEAFVTFSDHCVSDGGLYANNGFVADKELPADYMYVVGNERKHKFGYRLKRFRDDPDLKWEDGLTETELAELNGLSRIWDAGKTRWVKRVVGEGLSP